MEHLSFFIDLFVHLDHHVNIILAQYGAWTYLLVFFIIFCETGLVATPFLPGDSLLFVLGALSVSGSVSLGWLLIILIIAAVLGDTVNYGIGQRLAPKIFRKEGIRLIKREYWERTHQFYEKYGGKTIIIARFVPIIRTFAPFLAGVGKMTYWRFAFYNVIGGALWVGLCLFAGYFFGNIPIVKKNFSFVVLVIICISLLPAVIEFLRHRKPAVTLK